MQHPNRDLKGSASRASKGIYKLQQLLNSCMMRLRWICAESETMVNAEDEAAHGRNGGFSRLNLSKEAHQREIRWIFEILLPSAYFPGPSCVVSFQFVVFSWLGCRLLSPSRSYSGRFRLPCAKQMHAETLAKALIEPRPGTRLPEAPNCPATIPQSR